MITQPKHGTLSISILFQTACLHTIVYTNLCDELLHLLYYYII